MQRFVSLRMRPIRLLVAGAALGALGLVHSTALAHGALPCSLSASAPRAVGDGKWRSAASFRCIRNVPRRGWAFEARVILASGKRIVLSGSGTPNLTLRAGRSYRGNVDLNCRGHLAKLARAFPDDPVRSLDSRIIITRANRPKSILQQKASARVPVEQICPS
jgi:hypothetical protein